MPEFMYEGFGVGFYIHTIVQLNLKFTRSMITISCPYPPKDTFSHKSFVIYMDEQLIAWKVFIHEPIHDSFTPSLTIVVPRVTKKQHN